MGNRGSDASENLALTTSMIYNPKPRPQRPFEADYPGGASSGGTDEAGRLTHTIDGTPLTARFVAGRREAGGADQGLSRGEFDAIAEAITGRLPTPVAPGQIGGAYGRISVDRLGRPYDIYYNQALKPEVADRAVGHEVGHAIDFRAGGIPTEGRLRDMQRVYHDLATYEHRGARTGPEHLGYVGKEMQQRELVAEGIRAYLTDPNYIKTVTPALAAWLRKYVNENPNLNKIIQLNALTALGGAGLLGASTNPSDAATRDEIARVAERSGMSAVDAMLFARGQSNPSR